MSKRLVVALGIWIALMFVWTQFFAPKDDSQSGKKDGKNKIVKKSVEDKRKSQRAKSLVKKDIEATRAAVVNTSVFSIGLNKVDGSVDSWKILKYKENKAPIDFVGKNVKGYRNFKVSFNGLLGAYKQKEINYSYKKLNEFQHEFTGRLKNGLVVKKIYSFFKDENYFDLKVTVINKGNKTGWKGENDINYSLIWGSSIDWQKKGASGAYDKKEIVFCSDKNELEEADDEDDVKINSFKWLGIHDRYFLCSIIPIEKDGTPRKVNKISTGSFNLGKNNSLMRFSVNRESETIPLNGSLSDNYRIFLGPKKYAFLTSAKLSQYKLDTIFSGFALIKWLSIGIEWLIYLVHTIFSNFGIVIIVVTLIIKVILYPLTHKSIASMRKMQFIQPKLNALKEQYKNDRQMQQRKMMELYKKEGINPMGGCLPLLLQLPIFIALYQVLPRLVDLKNVSFLWIKDLSSPDTVATIEAFKNIPIIPANINILPIIMTVFSLIQSKMSTAGNAAGAVSDQQKQQSKMMLYMPILFLFIFWKMPSGLVLYWTVQNILMIAQQWFVNRKFEKREAAATS